MYHWPDANRIWLKIALLDREHDNANWIHWIKNPLFGVDNFRCKCRKDCLLPRDSKIWCWFRRRRAFVLESPTCLIKERYVSSYSILVTIRTMVCVNEPDLNQNCLLSLYIVVFTKSWKFTRRFKLGCIAFWTIGIRFLFDWLWQTYLALKFFSFHHHGPKNDKQWHLYVSLFYVVNFIWSFEPQ